MSFVGVISNSRDFKIIRKAFEKKEASKNVSLIEINENNIDSLRNITFETLFFCKDLNCSSTQKTHLENICKNASYIVINNDFNSLIPHLSTNKCTVISFGLDQKSTITVSSISENGFVLSLQKNILANNNELYEMEERCIKTRNTNSFTLYKILIEYIVEIIYKA